MMNTFSPVEKMGAYGYTNYTTRTHELEGRRNGLTATRFLQLTQILVSRSDLLENQRVLTELEKRVEELNAESTAQLLAKEQIYSNKIQEVTAKFENEIFLLTEVNINNKDYQSASK
jgi:tRNA nucleotidyltransferase/poly(A) polymerase